MSRDFLVRKVNRKKKVAFIFLKLVDSVRVGLLGRSERLVRGDSRCRRRKLLKY